MEQLPKLTRFIRSHSNLEPREPLKDKPFTNNHNTAFRESVCQDVAAQWHKIVELAVPTSGPLKTVADHFHSLRQCAKETAENPKMIDEIAIMFLEFFLDQGKPLVAHWEFMLRKYGLNPEQVNQIYSIVKSIVSEVDEETVDKIRDQIQLFKSNTNKLQWCGILPYRPPNVWAPPDTSFLADLVNDNRRTLENFSMAYNITDKLTKEVPPAAESKKAVYGKAWLLKEIERCCSNNFGVTAADITESVTQLLTSSKTSDELQNELFDLLGFDNIELIQSLLEHRKDISLSHKLEMDRKMAPKSLVNDKKNELFVTQVTVNTSGEKLSDKQARKEGKKLAKFAAKEDVLLSTSDKFDPVELRAKRIASLSQPAPTIDAPVERKFVYKPEVFPHVYDSVRQAQSTAGVVTGVKLMLPDDVKRVDNKQYESVYIPIPTSLNLEVGKNLIPVSSLDKFGQMAFDGVKNLNRIQSVVFETAYNTNENLLICAPTGAGKTNIALLTIMHTIRQFIEDDVIKRDSFKIVYVAPMKALASEMTENFSKKLSCLGIKVRELTGDMQLTKAEILQTQMLVTTPEKWDVVTRKSTGDVALAKLVKLLIIDEVHLLHGDRGPVIEALVARTLRQVETSQSMIRIVGLSATLPNYIDVARFLRVNPYHGLFYFDGRFRPVPLEQTFIGIKAVKPVQQMTDMDAVCYEKAYELVSRGHQVMVFVHARNATNRVARCLMEMARSKGQLKAFKPEDGASRTNFVKAFDKSRSKELGEFFACGFSIHHAGLLRSDRNLVEKAFSAGHIKLLVCTSTLAWGVNLPAHAVIIRGTEIYDAKHGSFIDLSILDVLQIFGRAGRPQFDTSGHGIIMTTHNKLSYYLSLLTNQYPIESSFINFLADNLNAEISLGTISNVDEAVEWLSYTYLYVRMRINPQVYGLNYQDVENDPLLETRRRELIDQAAKSLDKAEMIRYNTRTGDLAITDLGRTASHFYIKYDTVEVFNEKLKEVMNESEVLSMVSHAQEFQQLKVRDDEMDELEELAGMCEFEVPGGKENLHGKVNILMQSYLNKQRVKSFSLMSDLSYISQNAVRIIRALFEIMLRKNNALLAGRILQLALMMEHQLWNWQTPLRHFSILSFEILEKIEARDLSIDTIREMDSADIGTLIRHSKMGVTVKKCAFEFPLLELSASLHPITRTILRVKLSITPDFRWNDKVHGKTSESYWVWIENPEDTSIYHSEYFLLTRKQVILKETQELVMTVPLVEPIPPQYIIRVINDRWLGCSNELAIGVQNLILPESHPPHTELLDLQPLPVKALNNVSYEKLYKFTHFNPIQTQLFHCLYHTDHNVLLGAPTGSGKTIMAEIAMFRVFNESPGCKVVYVAPLKALVRERMDDWKARLENHLKKSVVELTGDVTPDVQAINNADVIVTTPEKWDGISRSWQTRGYVQKVALIVLDEVHLLGEDRGPVLEVIVSRTNFISAHTEKKLRIVALSTALANARDLANWLGIKHMGLYNFRPAVRPVPLRVHISGFPGKHYCPRMATMNRPVFQAITQHSPSQPALVFVSSRRQTRLTALDLIAYLAGETNPKQWLHLDESDMDSIISTIKDTNLRLTLAFGIGIHHAGLQERDRKTVEELFVNQKIQVLIATATLAWGVNFPAHLVVVKGTEYFDGKSKRYVDMPITDVLQMMGRAGRPQFDNEGVAVILVHDVKKNFYKKFLYEPFPVESSLLDVLPDHLSAEIVAGTIGTKQDALDYLTWTYFFRRLLKNPSYYDLESLDPKDMNEYLSKLVDKTLMTLYIAGCVSLDEDGRTLSTTSMGRIAAYYYLSHKTMLQLREQMNPGLNLEKCMYTLCHVHEYSQVPVRHNEENYNGEIAKQCPWHVDQLQLDSPHIKTFLLLQAHFSRLELPSTDYYTDLKSVLDQSIRILQGMLDVAAESGWLALSLRLQNLMQMMMQGRWLTDSPFTALPHVEPYMAPDLHRKSALQTLPKAVHRANESYGAIAPLFMPELDETQIIDVYNVLSSMPILRVTTALNAPHRGQERTTPLTHRQQMKPVEVDAASECTLTVTLERVNKYTNKRAYAPKFHKAKNEGWFLSLGESFKDELMALRRVAFSQRRTTAQLVFYTPERPGPCTVTLYVMSDTYLGLDQEYDLVLDVKPNTSLRNEEES